MSKDRPMWGRLTSEAVVARFAKGTLRRIKEVMGKGEARSDFLRIAVENEIRRRIAGDDKAADEKETRNFCSLYRHRDREAC